MSTTIRFNSQTGFRDGRGDIEITVGDGVELLHYKCYVGALTDEQIAERSRQLMRQHRIDPNDVTLKPRSS